MNHREMLIVFEPIQQFKTTTIVNFLSCDVVSMHLSFPFLEAFPMSLDKCKRTFQHNKQVGYGSNLG